MDDKFFVYLLRFAGGKVYVGMSRTDSRGSDTNRYRQHAAAAKAGKQLPVYNAWRKHGAPELSILSRHSDRASCALAEIEAIQTHASMDPMHGYNLMPGGEGLHAPPDSAIYELMRDRVWNNPAWRRKLSEALKGRPVSAATREAQKAWRESPEGKATLAAAARSPERRAKVSAATIRRMQDPAQRAYLSLVQTGKPKKVSPEGKARTAAARAAYHQSAEGRAKSRLGAQRMRANPVNEAKRKVAHAAYLQSEQNLAHCRAVALRNRKPIRVVATGQVYESRQALADALGVSGPSISYGVRTGKYEYL